ncbi:hypothetical protein NLI96_g10118 [Meripilus lineatus]|uniref:Retrotransposon gag domain-containing protein n=1 Tax=Meripilus lineatus TaxID=2056292 RepID=A0AAD5UU81_9APHY|nr:hypothetical protein NLI96_g10118 [Physisporinus lineatus]
MEISQGPNPPGAMPPSGSDVAIPDLVTAQWTTGRSTNNNQGITVGENSINREGVVDNGNRNLPVEDKLESHRGTPQLNTGELNAGTDNVRLYLRSVNRTLAKVSERVSRMRREQMAVVDRLNETDDMLDELMHEITQDRLRIEQGIEGITQFQSALTEPAVEAAISSLKSQRGKDESRENYERRMGAVHRLGLNPVHAGEPGSVSQRIPTRGTRFSRPMTSGWSGQHQNYRENRSENRDGENRSNQESHREYGNQGGRGYHEHRETPPHQDSYQGGNNPNRPPAGGAGGPPNGPPDPGPPGDGGNSSDDEHSEERRDNREKSIPVSRRMRSMTPYFGDGTMNARTPPRLRQERPMNNRLYSRDEYGRVIDNSFAWIRDTIQQNLAADIEEIPRSIKPPEPEKYDGGDDLEDFDKWLLAVIRWMALSHLGGIGKERARLLVLGQFLSKTALEWYNTEVESPHRARRNWTFEEVICEMFDHFIHRTSGKVANQKFREVKYSTKNGVSHLFNEMTKWARRMIEVPTEYDQRVIFMGALPEEMQDTMRAARGINEERNTLDEIYYCALDIEEARLHNKTPREPGPSNRPPQTTALRYRMDQPYTNREGNRYIPREAYIRRNDQYKPTNRPVVFQKLRQPFAQARDGARHRSDERQPSSTKATQGSRPSASGAETKDRERPRDNDKAKVQCYTCKGYGHYANDATCPLRIKPAIRRFAEVPLIEEEEAPMVDAEDNNRTGRSAQEREDNTTHRMNEEHGERMEYEIDGSQYDSDESLYVMTEIYEPYESENEEAQAPAYMRAMTIAMLRGEERRDRVQPENASGQGPETEDPVNNEGMTVEPANTTTVEPANTTTVEPANTEEAEYEDMPALEEVPNEPTEESDIEIGEVNRGPIGELWRTEYLQLHRLFINQERENLRLRQRIREVEVHNRELAVDNGRLHQRNDELQDEIRILWCTHDSQVPRAMAQEVVENSMRREIQRDNLTIRPDIAEELEGRGELTTSSEDEQRMREVIDAARRMAARQTEPEIDIEHQ